jgi:hypothetical protein
MEKSAELARVATLTLEVYLLSGSLSIRRALPGVPTDSLKQGLAAYTPTAVHPVCRDPGGLILEPSHRPNFDGVYQISTF